MTDSLVGGTLKKFPDQLTHQEHPKHKFVFYDTPKAIPATAETLTEENTEERKGVINWMKEHKYLSAGGGLLFTGLGFLTVYSVFSSNPSESRLPPSHIEMFAQKTERIETNAEIAQDILQGEKSVTDYFTLEEIENWEKENGILFRLSTDGDKMPGKADEWSLLIRKIMEAADDKVTYQDNLIEKGQYDEAIQFSENLIKALENTVNNIPKNELNKWTRDDLKKDLERSYTGLAKAYIDQGKAEQLVDDLLAKNAGLSPEAWSAVYVEIARFYWNRSPDTSTNPNAELPEDFQKALENYEKVNTYNRALMQTEIEGIKRTMSKTDQNWPENNDFKKFLNEMSN